MACWIETFYVYIWAASWQNQQCGLCAQRRLRSDWVDPGVRPVWSESSLCAQWVAKDPSFQHTDRLGGRPGWSESWLGAHAILLVLSWGGSFFVTSFSMIRVKMSQLIEYFFELILKAYAWGVPNRTAILQDWKYQSFICCLFYVLWTSLNISYQEAKDPISLNANLINVCILW